MNKDFLKAPKLTIDDGDMPNSVEGQTFQRSKLHENRFDADEKNYKNFKNSSKNEKT